MNSCALALLAILASSILNSRAVNARTPPAVQSTPVCRLQGRAGGAAGGGGGGGGGLLAEEEETDEEDEEEGSAEEGGRDKEAGAEPEEEEEQGGEARGLAPSSAGRGFMLGVD